MEVLLIFHPTSFHRALLILNVTGSFTFGQAYDRLYNPVGLVQESGKRSPRHICFGKLSC